MPQLHHLNQLSALFVLRVTRDSCELINLLPSSMIELESREENQRTRRKTLEASTSEYPSWSTRAEDWTHNPLTPKRWEANVLPQHHPCFPTGCLLVWILWLLFKVTLKYFSLLVMYTLYMYSHTFGTRFSLPNVHILVWNFRNCQKYVQIWHKVVS
jgi:hypothetical protein